MTTTDELPPTVAQIGTPMTVVSVTPGVDGDHVEFRALNTVVSICFDKRSHDFVVGNEFYVTIDLKEYR